MDQQGAYGGSGSHYPVQPPQYSYIPEPYPSQLAPAISGANPAVLPGNGFFSPWEPTPAPANPPSDPETQKRIDKLVEYAAKNGPQFEALMKEKQKDNAAYAFLAGGEGNDYYRYRLWTAVNAQLAAGGPPPMATGIGGIVNESEAAFLQQYYDPQQQNQSQQSQQQQQQMTPVQFFPAYGPPPDQFGFQQQITPGQITPGGLFQADQFQQVDLPPDVAAEFGSILENLTGTKEGIKNAKMWFMQRGMYAQGLVRALQRRVQGLRMDPERQLHVIYLINDVLFNGLQHRPTPADLDPISLAFRPILGSILATIFHGPLIREDGQERLRKILDFWGAKDVFDNDTVNQMEGEMMAGPPIHEMTTPVQNSASGMFFPPPQWQQPQTPMPSVGPSPFFPSSQFAPQIAPPQYPPLQPQFPISSGLPPPQEAPPSDQPPYPLFPPGLIPGMVRKMQIGSGVPYSPISPSDIPAQIPPQTSTETYILKRIKKFFKQIGETDPLADENLSSDDEDDPNKTSSNRTNPNKTNAFGGLGSQGGLGGLGSGGGGLGGISIGPPPIMEVDPETGTLPDGSVASSRGGMGARAGLGATESEESQYGDVYSSYRKSRSSNYHTALSVRAAMKYEHA